MPAERGRKIAIQIGDGTSPGNFTTVGGIRSKSISLNNEAVDITDDDSAPWRALLEDAGIRSVSISGSGIWKGGAIIEDLEDAVMDGTHREARLIFENGDYFQGHFQITSMETGGEHNAERTFSISLESSGEVILVRI